MQTHAKIVLGVLGLATLYELTTSGRPSPKTPRKTTRDRVYFSPAYDRIPGNLGPRRPVVSRRVYIEPAADRLARHR